MEDVFDTRSRSATVPRATHPGYQAYQTLHFGMVAVPTIAGVDKFTHLLTNWDQYLAPSIAGRLPVGTHQFMMGVGVIELFAGLLVAVRPRIGAYLVAIWLCAIIANLVLLGGSLDIALRDFGLMLGAVALGRLGDVYGRHVPTEPSRATSR